MSEFFDPEYEIEKRLIKGFRSIFEKDGRFIYNKDNKITKLLITTDYPDNLEKLGFMPHIVVSNINLQNNLHNSFGYNFYRESDHKGFKDLVEQYAYIIQYSVTVICTAPKNISKDLANRLSWYISFAASKYLSEDLGLQISNISKGTSSPSKQFPEKVFDTPIQITGTLYWVGAKLPEGISNIDTPLKNVNIRF